MPDQSAIMYASNKENVKVSRKCTSGNYVEDVFHQNKNK